jgi:uncharacterized protein YwqG
MGFLARLLGRGSTSSRAAPLRDVEALAHSLTAPAVHAVHTRERTPSQLGGAPLAARGFAWPSRDGRPLTFLARIDMAQLYKSEPIDWLPATGALLFFYDVAEQPWGFDPADGQGWRVVYVNDGDAVAELPFPPLLDQANRLPKQFLAFQSIRSYPSAERETIGALALDEGESQAYEELQVRAFGDRPRHQLAGYPSPIQGDDMEYECELVSNGVYMGGGIAGADASAANGGGQTPAADAALSEWRLLLQMDSDEAADVMWGDAGIIYFWIRESDARARRFDASWVILQCY